MKKELFLKHSKKIRTIVFFTGTFLFAFVLGWTTCVGQVYQFFACTYNTSRTLYSDNYLISVFPLKIKAYYGYCASEENNKPVIANATVSLECNNTTIYPDWWEEVFRNKYPLSTEPFMDPTPYERTHYVEQEIKKIRYTPESHE